MNAPFLRPYGCPKGVEPHLWREAVQRRLEAILDSAQALLAALDEMDGDPDLEPSIVGGIEWRNGERVDILDDREGGDVLDEGEHSLGWTGAVRQDGPKWLAHDYIGGDREAEHDGREPDEDFESSLGGPCPRRGDADLESDELEKGEFDCRDHDTDLHIDGGGYHT